MSQLNNTVNGASQAAENVGCEESLFTQQQVNDIVARESAKALERLFRDIGCDFGGRAKEQQKEFVNAYRQLKDDLEAVSQQLNDCQKELDEVSTQKKQQEADIARLNAVNACLDAGIRPDAVADVLKLLPAEESAEEPAKQVQELLQKYPFFAVGSDRRVAVPQMPQRRFSSSDDRMFSIAKKMGLV